MIVYHVAIIEIVYYHILSFSARPKCDLRCRAMSCLLCHDFLLSLKFRCYFPVFDYLIKFRDNQNVLVSARVFVICVCFVELSILYWVGESTQTSFLLEAQVSRLG